MSARVFVILFFYLQNVLSQGTGSGTDGNLRLCIVEARGGYKRAPVHCPILDKENAGVECVIGTDRLDCIRRISKGTVDFGVFSPEDLIAAQWANVDVLVTNEIRVRNRPFARNIVAVVNKRILPDSTTTLHEVLRNSTLCHPGESLDDLKPLSETLSGYLETLILERSCDPNLSNTENKLKALASFYGKACKAGPWIPDKKRDAELKREFPSLCAACGSRLCSSSDRYYGDMGALNCLADGAGDVTWGEAADVATYFKGDSSNFAYLCRDGTWKGMGEAPCVWLKRPWNVVVSKRKAAEAVGKLTKSLNNTVTDKHWKGALLALLESNRGLSEPLQPSLTALDYLAKAEGFREAYSQTGCDPPRFINFCTTSILAKNKCEWLSEGGAVYGVVPSLQCSLRNTTEECLKAVASGECDAAVGDNDHLIIAPSLSIQPLLHEVTPIINKTNMIIAYVKSDSKIIKMADLRGKRAAFPRYDGMSWHSVLKYTTEHEKISCKDYIENYFSEICAPGMDGKNCYEAGDTEALKSLLDGKSDVAFVSSRTYNSLNGTMDISNIRPVCPDDNKKFCFISWSNLGHIFTAKNITEVRKHELVNVFEKLDQIFGKHPPFHSPMFSMYGPYNHVANVIFHSDTNNLATSEVLKTHPYNKAPFNFELSISNVTDFSCNFGAKIAPSFIMLVTLVVFVFSS